MIEGLQAIRGLGKTMFARTKVERERIERSVGRMVDDPKLGMKFVNNMM